MHQSSMDKISLFKENYLSGRQNEPLKIVDLGSLDVNGSYGSIFDVPPWIYRGFDMSPGNNVHMVLEDPYNWRGVKSGSVDVLISGQVFEHIEFFWITMLEIARILRSKGLCCIIAPSGGFEHRYPVDCWRFYPDGFSALARYAGLKVLEVSTQWTPDAKYTIDDSNTWKDTMVVCIKEALPLFRSLRRRLRLALMHRSAVFL